MARRTEEKNRLPLVEQKCFGTLLNINLCWLRFNKQSLFFRYRWAFKRRKKKEEKLVSICRTSLLKHFEFSFGSGKGNQYEDDFQTDLTIRVLSMSGKLAFWQ